MRPRGTTSTRVDVDEMTEADLPVVCAIADSAFSSLAAPAGPTEQNLREELARPWAHVWVARDGDGRAIGFLVFWHVVDEVHVLNVAVEPRYRRRGVARELMARALEFGQSRRVRHLLLEVRRSNAPAIALYRAQGFYAMGVRRAYYSDGEDAVEMVLQLDPQSGQVLSREDEVRLES